MGVAITINVTFKDNKGKSSTTKVRVPNLLGANPHTIVSIIETAQAIGQIFANLSSAKITSISVAVNVDLSSATIRAVANTAADIYQKALMVAKSVVGLFARFNFPTILDASVIDGTDQLDTADANVAAVISALEEGLAITSESTTTTVQPRDRRNNDLDYISEAREVFRAS